MSLNNNIILDIVNTLLCKSKILFLWFTYWIIYYLLLNFKHWHTSVSSFRLWVTTKNKKIFSKDYYKDPLNPFRLYLQFIRSINKNKGKIIGILVEIEFKITPNRSVHDVQNSKGQN